MRLEYWRYVPHANVSRYEAMGWKDAGAVAGHHGVWSVWMKWAGDGEPVEPEQAASGSQNAEKAK